MARLLVIWNLLDKTSHHVTKPGRILRSRILGAGSFSSVGPISSKAENPMPLKTTRKMTTNKICIKADGCQFHDFTEITSSRIPATLKKARYGVRQKTQ